MSPPLLAVLSAKLRPRGQGSRQQMRRRLLVCLNRLCRRATTLFSSTACARDAKIVARTVARVSASRVLGLLEVIVRKLERSPARFARLCPWLRAVLLHHTAYLVAQPDLVPSLSALYQLLETRLQVHEQMQKLAGRLTLVLGQIHVNTAANNDQEDDETRAAVIYHEGEEEVREEAANGDDSSSQEEEEEDEEDDDEDDDVETEDE
ncbi:WD40 repeat-containing protein [Phytophthora cinnamomi]|uniref:WD40 repeat-containing protein n=1 Tax=Phytophthora cinnamomi TaxID=4785 RepID=UPI0035599450|nr:WD40 repeat-containing protein [Phytophthora cinnamomi]